MRTESKITQVGLDNHKNFSRLTGRDSTGKIVFRQRLEHKDRRGLREDLRHLPEGTPVVLEGTFGWGWMSDELKACKLDPHLASSRKTAAWREARGMAKNNKIDADLLSELWSQPERWWEVWLAPPEVRDQREWLRYRMSLVRMQTALKNRIHATLHRHGVLHEFSDLFGKKGMVFLKGLCQARREPADPGAAEVQLSASGRGTLGGYLKLLAQVRQLVAQVTKLIRPMVCRSEEGERWRSLPGVSWVLAYTILAEVGPSSRFANSRKLSAYALLAPRADDSGDEDGEVPTGRRVGHMGRLTLKWAFIEAAHGAVRRSEHFKAIFDRRTDGGKRDRGRGFIAVGHELCKVGLSCCHYARDYSDERPPRHGSQEHRQARWLQQMQENQMHLKVNGKEIGKDSAPELPQVSRPGTGGPDHPMVAAAGSKRRRT
jgi:transposase